MNRFEAEVFARSVVRGMGETFNREALDTIIYYVGCFGILRESTWYGPRG